MPISSRELIRKLVTDGWVEVAQKGSHKQFRHPMRPGCTTVPHPKKELPIGTLRAIERQSGVKLL